jgi:hypothetical protein
MRPPRGLNPRGNQDHRWAKWQERAEKEREQVERQYGVGTVPVRDGGGGEAVSLKGMTVDEAAAALHLGHKDVSDLLRIGALKILCRKFNQPVLCPDSVRDCAAFLKRQRERYDIYWLDNGNQGAPKAFTFTPGRAPNRPRGLDTLCPPDTRPQDDPEF